MTEPVVSVCIRVFNGQDYVGVCIDYALGQTFPDFELLVVDNCSDDRTPEIVRSYHDQRIRYIRNDRNLGMGGNFNRCLELARGKYIVIIPHDDLILPT